MITVPVGDEWARAVFTERGDGDMGHSGVFVDQVNPEVGARRKAVHDAPTTWLRQVHGAGVVVVHEPGVGKGSVADAAITSLPDCPLMILTADCAPIAIASGEGVIAAVHAGWAGLLAGVVGAAVKEMRAAGAGALSALIGPCIRPECYEFGDEDLAAIENQFGRSVRSTTAAGSAALDLPATARAALTKAGVADIDEVGRCTACEPGWFSWRARGERERQAMVVWR